MRNTIKVEFEIIDLYSIVNSGLYIFGKNVKNVYSLYRIESIRHKSSPIILFDKLPCLPKSISFDKKVFYFILFNLI
ncbi:unnamed protein product [Rotaria sordida]|uniref:Uncharacterized protein n=1 Tax=Rotaria sordida TaxID=392033 RepID=A0A814N1L0_9BILA|nr:unnamed protein product [Rotaria sordida]